MKPKIWLKVFGALVVLAVASVVAVTAVLKSIDFNNFRTDVEALAKSATGRDVTIAGDLGFVVSMSPSLNMSDVTVSNAPWGVDQPMIVLKNLQAKVDLLSLLKGQLDVDYFVVDGLKLILQTDGKGRANWEFDGSMNDIAPRLTSAGLAIVPHVRDVRLKNVDLTYIDGATQARFHTTLESVNMKAETLDSPMMANIKATYNGVNVDIQSRMGSLRHLIGSTESGAFPVDLALNAKGLNVKVKGGVEQPSLGMKVDAGIEVSVGDMNTVAQLVGADLPAVKALKARFNVSGSGTRYALSAIDIKADGSDLTGNIDVDLSTQRPHFSGTLNSKTLDVASIMPPDHDTGAQTRFFSTDPLPLDILQNANVDLLISVKKIVIKSLAPSNVRARVTLDNGRLNMRPVNFSIGGGAIQGGVKISGTGKTQKFVADINLKGVDIGKIAKSLGYGDLVRLKLDGKVDVSAQGESSLALASNLNGSIAVFGRDGRINEGTISGLGVTTIRCLIGRLRIKNGEVTPEMVLLDTPAFEAQVTGNIDLPGERLHLTVTPKAKSTSLASFAVPVRIKGTLSKPYIGVDAKDVIVGTVGNIVKAPVGVLVDILSAITNTKAKDPCI